MAWPDKKKRRKRASISFYHAYGNTSLGLIILAALDLSPPPFYQQHFLLEKLFADRVMLTAIFL
jgi:hypothetical protein